MIRRNFPLGEAPSHWLLISQVEHARISHQLAKAWKDLLPGAPDEVREELLAAILHHDDGWAQWQANPKLDPEHGRPYGFMEMPPAEAQAIWTVSIDACRNLGPLAGWVVASHFIALQDKVDDDFAQWRPWLGEQTRRIAAWLKEWQAADERHTPQLAEACIARLQTFDWLSLWLCCRAPVVNEDPLEPLELGDAASDFGAYCFKPDSPHRRQADRPLVTVDPWPFAAESVEVAMEINRVPARRYTSWKEVLEQRQELPIGWSLRAKQR